jgi:hypothetical protein
LSRRATFQTVTLCHPGGNCEGGIVPSPFTTSRHSSNRWAVAPVVTVRMSSFPSLSVTFRHSSNRWAVSPQWRLLGFRASPYLLSRPATVQTAGLCRTARVQTAVQCRTGGLYEGVGRPKTSCHVPQQFKPLRCVAPVVIVRVASVPLPSVTFRNSSNLYIVSHRWIL